jgi:hypothetical protein
MLIGRHAIEPGSELRQAQNDALVTCSLPEAWVIAVQPLQSNVALVSAYHQ